MEVASLLKWWQFWIKSEHKFHIYSYNSKITCSREKSVTTKYVCSKISSDFCFNVVSVKYRQDKENASEDARDL